MNNLNKFTKAELISKFKKLDEQKSNNQNNIYKIINNFILFKDLILKLTFITILIKWIKKYSLVKKLWHIFSVIGSTLLGFSLIDIYSWDIISWIKDTSIYKWYFELFYKIEDKIERPVEFQREMNDRSSIETTTNETTIEQNSRNIQEHEIIQENESNYKKYFILCSIIIISGIGIWCYYNDIKPGDAGNTILDKIRSFRSWFNNDQTNIINNHTGNDQMNIPTNINEDIQLIDNTQPPIYNQSSTILTSPSLENLNEQAQTTWSEDASSPSGSDRTITQESISATSKLISNTWRSRLTLEVNDKINFVESCFNSGNEIADSIKLADYYAYIINEYNIEIQTYNYIKNSNNHNIDHLNAVKESIYYFREWIAEYQSKIFPSSSVTIEVGSIQDSPKILSKNIV